MFIFKHNIWVIQSSRHNITSNDHSPTLILSFDFNLSTINVQELANEKVLALALAQLQAALEAQEAEFAKRLERLDPLTKANVPETQTLSLIDDRLSIDKTVYSVFYWQ